MNRSRVPSIVALAVLSSWTSAYSGHTLSDSEKHVLDDWLAKKPGLRLATARDCRCESDIRALRSGMGGPWKPVPDYEPYVATGDFNGDGQGDFAVVVRSHSKSAGAWTLVVFNGGDGAKKPAYVDNSLDFRRLALFFGPPRPRPYRLVVGPFESHGATLEPVGASYRLDWGEY